MVADVKKKGWPKPPLNSLSAGLFLVFSRLSFFVVHYNQAIYDFQLKWIHVIYVGKREVSILLQKEAGLVK